MYNTSLYYLASRLWYLVCLNIQYPELALLPPLLAKQRLGLPNFNTTGIKNIIYYYKINYRDIIGDIY